MNIYGFNKSTLLDYPKHLAATVFAGRCNFLCPFCQNGSLVLEPNSLPLISKEKVLAYLKKRKNILEGVCITGGEPTLSSDLVSFIESIREFGYKIKLDTNGYQPEVLKQVLELQLVDYVAMDIKNSPQKYARTCGLSTMNMDRIHTSVDYLKQSDIDYEFRTTIVKEFHTPDDITKIGQWLLGAPHYFLQSFRESPDLIQPGLHAHDPDTLEEFKCIAKTYIADTQLRGIE